MWEIGRRQFLACASAFGGAAALSSPIRASFRSGIPSLTVYSGQRDRITNALVAAFAKSSGVEVRVRQGVSRQLSLDILAEGAASPADVFYSEESAPVEALAKRGLLARIDSDTLKGVPAEFVSADGVWVGVSARCRVIAYNTAMIDEAELPTSVLDLATADWRGEVGYVPTSGAFQEQIVAIKQVKGRDAALGWLAGLKKYGRQYKDNMAALEAVENGEVAMALISNYYWFALAAKVGKINMRSALHYVDNSDAGALVTISAAAALKSSRKSDLAQAFLAFLVSKEGQQAIVRSGAEYPLRSGVKPAFPLKPWSELNPPRVTPADLGDASDALALEREAGMA